jgi:hypothetical protein
MNNIDNKKINEALDETKAFNKITLDLLEQKRKEHFRLWIVILMLAAVNLIEFGIFAWYVSTEEMVTTTTTTTVEQDTNSGEGNNVYQSGEKAVYNDKGSD